MKQEKTAFDNALIDWGTYNSAVLFWEHHSACDGIAEQKRQRILTTPDTVHPGPGGTAYYISYRGDDRNDGTQSSPYKTEKPLEKIGLKSGDAVLFERGGIYRNCNITVTSGVSYGAYGTGYKPQLFGSRYNYAEERFWVPAGNNLWKLQLDEDEYNVGNLVFDFGVQCGKYRTENKLSGDFEFYEDGDSHAVYLYLSAGNPGKVYHDIEVCTTNRYGNAGFHGYAEGGEWVHDVTVENIAVKYTGGHAINFGGGCRNITVRGCEIGYVGGSKQYGCSRLVRYGNGIELFGAATGALIDNNWIYQCYDAGFTNQGRDCDFTDLRFSGNLVEYCQYNVEIWVHPAERSEDETFLHNCQYTDNILRFAGYNFEFDNRHGSNTSAAAHIATVWNDFLCDEDCVIEDNVFDHSYRYLVSVLHPNPPGKGFRIRHNEYYQDTYKNDEKGVLNPCPTEAMVAVYGKEHLDRRCRSQAEMEESVRLLDTDPDKIVFDGSEK